MKKIFALFLLTLCVVNFRSALAQFPPGAEVAINPLSVDPATYLDRIKLPPGFKISIYAGNVAAARSMALSPSGVLYVGSRWDGRNNQPGKVYAVVDKDGDYKADEVLTVASGLNMPNGVALRDGDLYVAEVNRITRYDDIDNHLSSPPAPVVINDSYPGDFMHGWKYIAFGLDGKLYVPVGAPGNTVEPDAEHSVITMINPDGSGKSIFARGIRNTVGFDWHPVTGELWFTDNGRDLWGSDKPPEELNHAPRAGLHFGYPYRYGKTLADDQFKTTLSDADFTPAALELPAHNAAIGLQFYTGKSFPEQYHNQAFIAAHGSWNRAEPDGYRIFVAYIKDNQAVDYEIFASGWLTEEKKFWGRPVDFEILPDGSLLVSDDFANCIYRIRYEN
jgi:glucose/arabinose dehydrogenase